MKRISLLFTGALLALGLALLAAQRPAETKVSTKEVMRYKLHYAQGILEGIALENFRVIATNAQKLHQLSQAADWQVRRTPEYQRFTAEFARQTDALAKAAREGSVDGATVSYFRLTVSCVDCHRYLRGTVKAELPRLPNSEARLDAQ